MQRIIPGGIWNIRYGTAAPLENARSRHVVGRNCPPSVARFYFSCQAFRSTPTGTGRRAGVPDTTAAAAFRNDFDETRQVSVGGRAGPQRALKAVAPLPRSAQKKKKAKPCGRSRCRKTRRWQPHIRRRPPPRPAPSLRQTPQRPSLLATLPQEAPSNQHV